MSKGIKKALSAAEPVAAPEPMPLRRRAMPASQFPIEALGKTLGDAAAGISDRVQCPLPIAVNSVLACASLAVQAMVDVAHPDSRQSLPTSLFLVTIAESGERKSTADAIALTPIAKRESELRKAYKNDLINYDREKEIYEKARNLIAADRKMTPQQKMRALKALGDPPSPPVLPALTAPDPTIEGLHKYMAVGPSSFGVLSDEGGAFIGGYGMSDEARLRTAAGFSKLWDGAAIKRMRSGDETLNLPGRRVCLHLMAQPGVAEKLVADETLRRQGFSSRLLVAAPDSLIGSRFSRKEKRATNAAINRYVVKIFKLLKLPQAADPDDPRELKPRQIRLSVDAANVWREYHNSTEGEMKPEGRFETIKGFASKLGEHALRIAAVLQIVDSPNAREISKACMERGVAIAEYYAVEATRLFDVGSDSFELQNAERLLRWLQTKWNHPIVALQHVYQLGPNPIRNAASAREALTILEAHGWVRKCDGGAEVKGTKYRFAWHIVGR